MTTHYAYIDPERLRAALERLAISGSGKTLNRYSVDVALARMAAEAHLRLLDGDKVRGYDGTYGIL